MTESLVAADIAPRLLVVDDESSIFPLVERFADAAGFATICRQSAPDALASLAELRPDVALVDLRMPGLTGLDVLRAIRVAQPDCQVILMTGAATIDTAVEAVKAGALDYLSKPLDFERLRGLLVEVRAGITRREQLLQVDSEAARQIQFHGMTGRTPAMQALFDSIRRLAPHARSVLVTGETGTGKELVAQALHRSGPRRHKRLLTVNCSAVVEGLFESELFGHVRGAFTGATDHKVGLFEHAHESTLFLDEAGELPLALQAKLLRAIEYGEVQRVGSLESRHVDVNVIAATNRDLRREIPSRFRADLFYRLSIIELHLVPLRERREDIPYLTAVFLRECATRLNRLITGLSPSAERRLLEAPWPGNIRELRNVIERACILTDNRILSEHDLGRAMTMVPTTDPASRNGAIAPSHQATDLARAGRLDRTQLEDALRQARGNKAEAARRLGLSRQSIYRWIDRLNVSE
jgi:two-component system, NtrC family, response regulator HydG